MLELWIFEVRVRFADAAKVVTLAIVVASAVPFAADAAGPPAITPPEIIAGMQVVVARGGSVSSVVPDADLPQPLREMLPKRVSQWHYSIPKWHGVPVSHSIRQTLWLQPVPTTTGGFALRVMPGGSMVMKHDDDIKLPAYPSSEVRAGIGGTFVYEVRLQPDGSSSQARRRLPDGRLDRHQQRLDESALDAINRSRWPPVLVNGAAIACDILFPIVFTPAGGKPQTTVEGDTDAIRQGMPDLCPRAFLETKIEGTLL